MEKATEAGDMVVADKMNRRNVKVTGKHVEECKKLLSLMGVPWLQAPCEAEAQCAALVKDGIAFAAASEDMDTLTFGSNILLRHLTFSEAKKMPIQEIQLEKALCGMGLDQDQFIDLCILLGCDYCDTIKGIGPVRALSLIKAHQNLEGVISNLDSEKYRIPENWPFQSVRGLFKSHNVLEKESECIKNLKWVLPSESGLLSFMVAENGFSEVRIRNAINKIVKAKNTAPQGRLDSFFKISSSVAQDKRKPDKVKKASIRAPVRRPGKALNS